MSSDMRLLLIEDDVHVAEVLRLAFDEAGHETTVKHTGEEGLTQLALSRPDAILLDVRLPKLNGIAVLRQVRATDPTLPVILLTGQATEGELAEARRLGVAGVLEKPYVLKRFSEALDRITPPGTPAGPAGGAR
jgi:two-component system, NtrC family, response regulator GlrR